MIQYKIPHICIISPYYHVYLLTLIEKKVESLNGEEVVLQVTVEGEIYHKNCFRCAHGGCYLTTSNYAALDGILYCKPHFAQLFKEKGCYNHVTKTGSKHSGEIPPEEIKAAALELEAEDKDKEESAEGEEEGEVVAQEQS